jgi:DNA-binding transcriptional ArsR family regulator
MATSSASRTAASAGRRADTVADHQGKAAHVAEVLKAVAHPLRIRIVAILCRSGEAHVNGLAEQLEVPQAIVSQQLRILRMRGLVEATRENGFAWYRLAEPSLRDLVCCMERCPSR